jgi:hypothetical protein
MSEWKTIYSPEGATAAPKSDPFPVGYGGNPVDPDDEIPMDWPENKSEKSEIFVLTYPKKCDTIILL